MTSTTTHSSHSSHASHKNTSHGSHANSISQPSYGYNAHTATIGGVDWSSRASSDTQLGTYGGTGSLTELIGVVNEMRTIISNNSGTPSSSEEPTSGAITSATITSLLSRSGGTMAARYQPGTATYNVVTNGTHGNTSGTSTLLAAGPVISRHSSTSGAGYHMSTSGRTGYGGPVKAETTTSDTAPTFTPGTKITKAGFNAVLSALQNNTINTWSGPAGNVSWTLSGSNAYHSSHSSHASHSSSKAEYKENIENIEFKALDLIKDLKLVSFNYKPEAVSKGYGDDSSIKHYGFLADNTDEKFSTQYHDRMDIMNCIGILLKAVQELEEKIK